MVEMDDKEVNKTAEINKYFEYTNKLVRFEDNIESCTKHHIEFWRMIMDSNPDIRSLEDLGTQITRSKDQLKGEFDALLASNPNSVHLLTVYGKFLLEVTNEETYNVKHLEKAEVILKNIKESSKIDETGVKYEENANTAVLIISGDDAKLGMVVHTNNLVKDLIGYQRTELLDRNIASIMPKIYGEHHNAVLRRYVNSSESKVNGHERLVPALTKEGFMLPATALTKVLPSLINGIQIVAFIARFEEVPEEEDSGRVTHFLLYRSDTEQILGISESCSAKFGISPCLIYGHPANLNNELKIEHIFGMSFEKAEEGRLAAALEAGEVYMSLDTRGLKDEFVINGGESKEGVL
jgi:PAS domain S-box-containing protein